MDQWTVSIIGVGAYLLAIYNCKFIELLPLELLPPKANVRTYLLAV